MFRPKIEVTNPEAVKLIADIKSGVFFAPYKEKIIKYKWYITVGLVSLAMLIALVVGKAIAGRTQGQIFLPPDLETPLLPTGVITKSKYESLRQEIIYFNSDLPDPVIPPFDNAIDLEQSIL